MSEQDDELARILDEIEDIGPMPISDLVEQAKEQPKRSGALDLPPSKVIQRDVEIEPVESKLPTGPVDPDEISDQLMAQFQGAIGRFNEMTEEVLRNYRTDRIQAQNAINVFFEAIERGGKIPRVFIEKLPDCIRAKNEIAMTPIRLLDSITKFMATTKNNNILIQNLNQGSGIDLNDLSGLLDAAENLEDDSK